MTVFLQGQYGISGLEALSFTHLFMPPVLIDDYPVKHTKLDTWSTHMKAAFEVLNEHIGSRKMLSTLGQVGICNITS